MRKLALCGGALAIITSCALVGGHSYAARWLQPAPGMMQVRLCTSTPFGTPTLQLLTNGINNAVILAGEQWKARFRAAHLSLLPPISLDDTSADGKSLDPARERRNAQLCLARHDTFGFIGPLNSFLAPSSMPVLNRGGMVQISPGNTNPTLTSGITRAGLEPATYRRRLPYVTYYRMITTDALQGPSATAFLKDRLHATSYFLANDPTPYRNGLAGAMKAYAGKLGLRVVGSAHVDLSNASAFASSFEAVAELAAARHPDGVLYAGIATYPGTSASLAKDLRLNGYTGPLVGGDEIVDDQVAKNAGNGERNVFGTIPGPDILATAPSFRRTYVRRFHVAVQQYDAPAYDEANIELYAIYMAKTHDRLHGVLGKMRAALLPFVAGAHWYGATGVTSFDRNGDTLNRIVSVYGTRNGTFVFVGVAPQVRGVSPAG